MKILADGAPGVERRSLIGTIDEIRQSIHRYAAVGVDYLMIDTFYGAPEIENQGPNAVLHTMERFAREVMPEFRG